jgi:stringent starvation protein B
VKLRLQGNSIRLRLNRKEVAEFVQAGRLQDVVSFGAGMTLTYGMELSKDTVTAHALFDGSAIRITVPLADAQDWARSDRVAMSGQDRQLSILIEKDFQCMHAPDPDAYPNPDAAHN